MHELRVIQMGKINNALVAESL